MLESEPGENTAHTNIGSMPLGAIIEKESGLWPGDEPGKGNEIIFSLPLRLCRQNQKNKSAEPGSALPDVQSAEGRFESEPVGNTCIESHPHPVLITVATEVVCVRRDIQDVGTVIHARLRGIPV